MSTITIVLLGEPVANARHRTTKSGHTYTPAETKSERNRLKAAAEKEMIDAHLVMFEGPIMVQHRIERPLLKSFSGVKRQAALRQDILPITRPDFDNYAKMVDAFNGIVWKDDSQICRYEMTKVYSEQPKVIFQIKEI